MALMTKSDSKAPRPPKPPKLPKSPHDRRVASSEVPLSHKDRRAKAPDTDRGRKDKAKSKGDSKGKGSDKANGPESFVPSLPSVNILPPTVTERAHVARLQRGFAAAALVAVAGIAGAYVLQSGAISSANDTLAQNEATSAQLSAEAAKLAPVKVYYATVQADEATIQQTMAREVLMSDVVQKLYATTPPDVDLGTVAISVDSKPVAAAPAAGAAPAAPAAPSTTVSGACPSPDPYVVPGAVAGCITITGTAVSRTALGDWETQIGRSDLFANLFIASSDAAAEDGPAAITFSASVSITDKAYVNRYADPAFVEGTSK